MTSLTSRGKKQVALRIFAALFVALLAGSVMLAPSAVAQSEDSGDDAQQEGGSSTTIVPPEEDSPAPAPSTTVPPVESPSFPSVLPPLAPSPTLSGELGGYSLPLPEGAFFELEESDRISGSDASGVVFGAGFACPDGGLCYSVGLF